VVFYLEVTSLMTATVCDADYADGVRCPGVATYQVIDGVALYRLCLAHAIAMSSRAFDEPDLAWRT
jgi:hypothetical protein